MPVTQWCPSVSWWWHERVSCCGCRGRAGCHGHHLRLGLQPSQSHLGSWIGVPSSSASESWQTVTVLREEPLNSSSYADHDDSDDFHRFHTTLVYCDSECDNWQHLISYLWWRLHLEPLYHMTSKSLFEPLELWYHCDSDSLHLCYYDLTPYDILAWAQAMISNHDAYDITY